MAKRTYIEFTASEVSKPTPTAHLVAEILPSSDIGFDPEQIALRLVSSALSNRSGRKFKVERVGRVGVDQLLGKEFDSKEFSEGFVYRYR
jgi:hypothetical protein